MIGFISRIVVIAALGVFAAAATPRTEHVFIISLDGGSPAVMQRSRMPVLQTLVCEGAVTWTAQTIRPSITLPAHTSMLTGVRMEKHGVTWNDWLPTNGLVRVPTVFTAAKAAGFSTAMFVGKEKFRHLLQPGTVDEFCFDRAAAHVVAKSDSGK
ncbi:MAG: alkaline phosphatase family protein, partial [Verrucomicrobia bacterium]|nr:alkaline phosphatase family protein [Verrucomicrobiota bacterium]